MKTKGISPFHPSHTWLKFSMICMVILMILSLNPACAQTRGSGNIIITTSELEPYEAYFYKTGVTDQEVFTQATQIEFNSQQTAYFQAGYRLVDLELDVQDETLFYSAIFEEGTGPEFLDVALTWEALTYLNQSRSASGFGLQDIETYRQGGVQYFAAVWAPMRTSDQRLVQPTTLNMFLAQVQEYANQGYAITDLETFESKNQIQFFAKLDFTHDNAIFIPGLSWNEFHKKFHDLNKGNYRLVDFDSYTINGTAYYNGVWHSGTQEDWLSILDPNWEKEPIETYVENQGMSLWDLELILEHPDKESVHGASSRRIITKLGITGTGDPTGTLMPLHNGSSSGPGN